MTNTAPTADVAAGADVPATGTVSARTASVTDRRRRTRLRLLVLAVLIGLMAPMMTVAATAEAAPIRPYRTAYERYLLWSVWQLINAQRAAYHLPPVRMNWELRTSSRHHNEAMARANTMSHQLRGEPVFSQRMSNAGYNWSWAGENIAYNSNMTLSGVLILQRMMFRERAPYNGHRLNILNRNFAEVGVDVLVDHAHHKVWLTTDFGRRR